MNHESCEGQACHRKECAYCFDGKCFWCGMCRFEDEGGSVSYFGFDEIVGTLWTEAPWWVRYGLVPPLVVILAALVVRWWTR